MKISFLIIISCLNPQLFKKITFQKSKNICFKLQHFFQITVLEKKLIELEENVNLLKLTKTGIIFKMPSHLLIIFLSKQKFANFF